jgi:hypothetical protein
VAALERILGPAYTQFLSGDPVEDAKDLDEFASGVSEKMQWHKDADGRYWPIVGRDAWPAPIPAIKVRGRYVFDAKTGLEEALNRRIGDNELSAIDTCRAYVLAQWEYFLEGTASTGLNVYAAKLYSTPGHHDGLYWETPDDATPSPLGRAVAEARAEGYPSLGDSSTDTPKEALSAGIPYHGYFFRVISEQGDAAPGGKFSYLVNGNMLAGFALVAYPAKWGSSGIMTFMVNAQGRVYEKNLGPDTEKAVAALKEYNPDPSWRRVTSVH